MYSLHGYVWNISGDIYFLKAMFQKYLWIFILYMTISRIYLGIFITDTALPGILVGFQIRPNGLSERPYFCPADNSNGS